MDGQIPTPNVPNPAERSIGPTPEDLRVGPAVPEMGAAPANQPAAAPRPVAPAPKLSAADVAAAIAATPTVGALPIQQGPAVAADVDLIEPEWVEKADEVIAAHRGDPYSEEEAIQDLQEDYLQKRYGINVADPNGDSGKPKKP